MAGGMRKMAVYLGLVEDDSERYDRYEEYDVAEDYADEAPEPGRSPLAAREVEMPATLRPRETGAARRGATALGTDGALATVARPLSEPSVSALDRITTIHPRSYNDAKQIGESFRGGTPVIMNLTDMDDADAKRLVDFAAGLIFGLRGTIERVTSKVFLLSPANVSVTAEERARMAENGFFNQS
jgi:cell division inhibitor SepF